MKPGTHDHMRQTQPPPAEINALIALYNARHYAELESRALFVVDQYPDFGFGWKLLGGALQMQGKNALQAFQNAADLMPNEADAHYNLGVVLKSLGRFDNAAVSYRRAVELKPDYIEAHSNLGNVLKDLGQLDNAIKSYRIALKLNPDSSDAHYNLGNALKDLGQLDDAVRCYRHAVALKPDFSMAYYNLGNALKDLRQLDDAVSCYRKATEINPDFFEVHNNLGIALKALGQHDAALASYRRALELNPELAETHNNVGITLKDLGQLDAALASFRKAVELKPGYADAHNNLGSVLQYLGQSNAALASYSRAVELKPEFADAHSNLGSVLLELGQIDGALASCRKAVELKPDSANVHNNLGIVLKELGQFDAALASYRRVLDIEPDCAEAFHNLGNALMKIGQFDGAVTNYRRALEIKPDYALAHSNLGIALKNIGQFDDALASYRRALEIKPDYIEAQSNLLFTLNHTVHTPEYCLNEATKYGRMAAQLVTERFLAWKYTDQPELLRVGLVSGDLCNHPVGFFLKSLLSQLDYARIELIAYPTHRKEDELTARIKPFFSAWKPLVGLSDEAAARLIHADGVHVLIDLSGHTGHNRLPVFAWKPAPVQVSWLGYWATTGVAEMDYLLADEVSVPELQQKNFSETVWYLPDTRLCFSPPEFDLPVTSLPALQNGYLTFGCFQNLSKVGNEVLTVWGKIFGALPKARLRCQCKQLGDPAVAAQFVERLQRHGIEPARVMLQGAMPRKAYLAAHGEVDVVLDTFPYPGGTTTCEALWMGVPTLTLSGDTLLARQGASLLTAAGMEDWVTSSVVDYIDKAVTLAGDLPELAALRAGLRQQVLASPLFDAQRFARTFEDALWGMWQA
jgi:protein O-GlcNAc transferase